MIANNRLLLRKMGSGSSRGKISKKRDEISKIVVNPYSHHDCHLCDQPALSYLNGHFYCNKHFCSYIGKNSEKCRALVSSENAVCYNHKCSVPTCNLQIDPMKNSRKCVDHTCKFNDCTSSKLEDDTFCPKCNDEKDYKCTMQDCYRRISENAEIRHCYIHNCGSPIHCTKIQIYKCDFCPDHKCSVEGCNNIATKVNGKCTEHKMNPSYPPSNDHSSKHTQHIS